MQKERAAFGDKGSWEAKVSLAEMLKGGVIIDVTSTDQARAAEDAGAVAVVVMERLSEDEHGIIRMSDPEFIQQIQKAVSIPVMAKCRIGHIAEAQILEALFLDFIDESEHLTAADRENYIDKKGFRIPFVSGCSDLGEALRRIAEGAAMIRIKSDQAATNIVDTVRDLRLICRQIKYLTCCDSAEWMAEAYHMDAPYEFVQKVAKLGRLPVPLFASGGITTPADAALMMQLGAQGVFVGSQIFDMDNFVHRVRSIAIAVANFRDPEVLTHTSGGLNEENQGDEILSPREW